MYAILDLGYYSATYESFVSSIQNNSSPNHGSSQSFNRNSTLRETLTEVQPCNFCIAITSTIDRRREWPKLYFYTLVKANDKGSPYLPPFVLYGHDHERSDNFDITLGHWVDRLMYKASNGRSIIWIDWKKPLGCWLGLRALNLFIFLKS